MTNKLPVVGKRYRLKNYKAEVINVDSEGVTYLQGDKEYWDFLDDFRDYFEELPEDKAETKPETQSHISQLSPEVKEAMEELDKELDHWMPTEDKEEYQLTSKVEKLLNALDKQFMSKEEDKIDTSSEVCLSNNEMKPNENGSFKHLDNAEEISQDIMKE